MQQYEYKVIQASDLHPGGFWRKARERTAETVTELLNKHGTDGWEFLRTEVLRVVSKGRFGGSTETEVNVLIFRRGASGARLGEAKPLRLDQGRVSPPVSRKMKAKVDDAADIALAEIVASSNANRAPANLPHRL